ncbi:ABC transporter ATP-binding protein [Paenibacillus bovis]|uniref:Iron ABC transporter ATP-binding protein n=1 Tax=Paenibacillus bovis TaxID=1616788 RepID=A0A172ZKZ5_9BACL|nr:ABC transporter ATP-binding protein [Paenibacillus bovis]ANF98321.1 iron ABC transporter ATP-binding protein [Paenibacillus bovis]
MLEVKNLSKTYNGKKVVDDVSLTINKGQITSFIGPNGAGKSTLLSMISRLITRDQGEVWLEGREIGSCDSRELARTLAILKQANHIELRLTIRELVAFGRFPYSQGRLKKEDERHVDEAIAYMELTEMQHKYLDELSGGQKQRAYIAMVLAQDTEYILLDEPLNNLDMKHSVQIMQTLRRMVQELGKTIVLVIHDINFASCYSDRIVALKNGRIVQEGSVEQIIDSDVLRSIYDLEIGIQEIEGQRICTFYA